MKIGIVTFWNAVDNYGQILQSFALIRYLQKAGHEVFLIKYISKSKKRNFYHKLLRLLYLSVHPVTLWSTILFFRQKLESEKMALEHPRYFDRFREVYIPSTPICYTIDTLLSKPPYADIYICGSDQIWGNLDEGYYLQFAPSKAKCIAYAPSFGGITLNMEKKEILKKYLSRFIFLGLRENSGVSLCHELGYANAVLVPDPTLLLPKIDYQKISNIKKSFRPYLLLYLLGNKISVDVKRFFLFANHYNLDIKYVASQGRVDKYPKLYPSVEEWIGLIENAKYVITNSYHGTIFSLIFNKNFLTIPVSGVHSRMNVRIEDLLSKYGLRDRIFGDNLDFLLSPVDFSKFNEYRELELSMVNKTLNELF